MFRCSHQPSRFKEKSHNFANSLTLDDAVFDLAYRQNKDQPYEKDNKRLYENVSTILQEFKEDYLSKYIGIFLRTNDIYDFLQMHYAQKQKEFNYQPQNLEEAILISDKLKENKEVSKGQVIKLRNTLGNVATYYFNKSDN